MPVYRKYTTKVKKKGAKAIIDHEDWVAANWILLTSEIYGPTYVLTYNAVPKVVLPFQAVWALSKHFVALCPSCLLRLLQPRIIKRGIWDMREWGTLETLEGRTFAMEARLKAGPSPCAMACNQIWGIPVIEPARPAWRSRFAWSAPECKYIEAA